MAKISIFEDGVALMDATSLRQFSAFELYPWTKGTAAGFEHLVLRMLDSRDTIAPGRFTDDLGDDSLDNADCSFEDHARRVAWFVLHGHDQFHCCACLHPQTQVNQPVAIYPQDGNHRLAAAVISSRPIIVNFSYGSIGDVETLDGFIQWESKPTPALRFGSSTISNEKQCWEVRFDEFTKRMYVNDIYGRCRVKLQLSIGSSMILWDDWKNSLEQETSLMLRGSQLTPQAVMELLSTRVSTIFSEDDFHTWFERVVMKHFKVKAEPLNPLTLS